MASPFDSISIKIAYPEEIKALAKRTCCKRRSSTVAPDEPFTCPEMHTCNCGEVKKAETINYRSFRPEPEGLFCEAIFGPSKDWECNCGKYKRIKHKGVICDRCGVEVTRQYVRRERMGYIQLASPVSHIWFFKGVPSRIGAFCELSTRQIERVLYFEAFIVTEVDEELQKQGILKPKQLLTEREFDTLKTQYRRQFKAGAGAEVIAEQLASIDLEAERDKLNKELEATRSHQKKVKLAKQIKLMEDFIASGQRPEWMILDVLPVIPPDLRPLVTLDGGRFATSDLNDLYRRLIHRNNRLAKLIQIRSPEIILRNEKRMLQEAVDAFFDNGRHGRKVTGPGNRELKSLSHILKGKVGRFRQNLLGKRVDYSGRSVIVVGPELELHQCGIPKRMAVELFKPFIIERLQAYGYSSTIKRAKSYVEHLDPESPVWDVLEEVIQDHPVLLNRPPTLHRLGIQAFMPVLVEGRSIRIPPLVCKAFNADFDGDQMAVHVPLTAESQAEAKLLMLSSHNILKPSHGGPIAVPELDMVLGPSYLTKTLPEHAEDAVLLHNAYTTTNGDAALFDEIRSKPWYYRRYMHTNEVLAAHGAGQLKLHDSVQLFFPENGRQREPILTTVGRVIFNEVLPAELDWEDTYSGQKLPFFNEEAGGRKLSSDIVERCFNELGTQATVEVLGKIQKIAFEYATLSGISPSITDYITPDEREEWLRKTQEAIAELIAASAADADTEELENKEINQWFKALREMEGTMFDTLPELETRLVDRDEHVKGFSPVHIMADSGARARKNPFVQISAVIGLKAKQSGDILLPPITTSYRDGLDVIDYFNSTYGSRKGLVDTAMKTAASGYLTRKLVDVAQDVRVTAEDCGTFHGIKKFATEGGGLSFKIAGRTATEDIRHPVTDEVFVAADTLITPAAAARIEVQGIKTVNVRSVLTCEADDGVCAKCYGYDLTTNTRVSVGEAVGIIAAQSIGEPGTQLTMRTFHTGGAVEEVSDARQRRILAKASGTVRFRDFHPGITVRKEGELWISMGPGIPPVSSADPTMWRHPIGDIDNRANLDAARNGADVKTLAPSFGDIGNRANLDAPAYKVTRVTHPKCHLKKDEQLSEKQFSENAQRYKGFDTEAWQHQVTAVHESACDLKVGDRLSSAQWHQARNTYGFSRFATEKREIAQVSLFAVNVRPGELLTEEEIALHKAEIRNGFDGEWCYRIPKTGEIFESPQEFLPSLGEGLAGVIGAEVGETDIPADASAEMGEALPSEMGVDTSVTGNVSFERVYRITESVHPEFPYEVGEIVGMADIAPWFTPFEEVPNPVYVIDADAPLHAGEMLSRYAYEEACHNYRPFESEKMPEELHHVTAVHHADCPLSLGQDLTTAEKNTMLARWMGFEVQKLRHRVTYIHHPACPLEPGTLMSDVEAKKWRREYPGIETHTESLGDTAATRINRITAVHHLHSTLQKGELMTPKEASAYRRKFKAFDVEKFYEVPEGHYYRVTEEKQAFKAEPLTGSAFTGKGSKRVWRVTEVFQPACKLEVGAEISNAAYQKAQKAYPDVKTGDILTQAELETWHPLAAEPVQQLTEAEYQARRKWEAKNKTRRKTEAKIQDGAKPWHRVLAVHHPELSVGVGEELADKDYKKIQQKFKGFDVEPLIGIILDEPEAEETEPETDAKPDFTVAAHYKHVVDDSELPVAKWERPRLEKFWRVKKVSNSECGLEDGQNLSETEYEVLCEKYHGFVDEPKASFRFDLAEILRPEEYRARRKYTVTAVYHPNCPYEVGAELSESEYQSAFEHYPGFDRDDPALQMKIEVETADGRRVDHNITGDYSFSIKEGDTVRVGETLAEHHERTANMDIVAGIPRVTDLFEARRPKPKDAAEIAEIEGFIESAGTKSGVPTYRIVDEGHESRLYEIPDEKRRVTEGDRVEAGQPLTDGYLNPHDILRIGRVFIEGENSVEPIEGEEAVWAYLIEEIQKVYGARAINDKHLEAIVRQMLTKVRVINPGDTPFHQNSEVPRSRFAQVNEKVVDAGGEPATGEPILQGISRASLSTDSFISAASFQQTTKVLTDAAVTGQTDKLFGLKENVILGRLIPAGSGFGDFQHLEITAITDEQVEAEEVSE